MVVQEIGATKKVRVSRDDMKRAAAAAALEYVEPGMIVGVGSGSTVAFLISLLSERRDMLAAVASSEGTAAALRAAGVPVVSLNESGPLPLYVDGADEVDSRLRLIKGAGGAHTREKVLAAASRTFVCIVDESKLVETLGSAPVPLEVLPMAAPLVVERVAQLGGIARARPSFVSDSGNAIFDVTGLDLSEPEALEAELDAIPGVVECGLFARRRADVVLVGTPSGVLARYETP
jgi:ribose 5-phosphate isomerase A